MISPSITFIIPTISFDKRLIRCVECLFKQNYDKKKLEVIISHGGKEKTPSPFKEKNVIIKYLKFFDNPEARKFAATIYASNDLICFIDSDNLPSSSDWLLNHVSPFSNDNILASYSRYYGYHSKSSKADKYFSLIGGNDPIVYHLKKNDRVEYLSGKTPYGLILETDNSLYSTCSFAPIPPVIGANGFFIRKKNFQKVLNGLNPEYFFHTDSILKIFYYFPNMRISVINDSTYHNSFLNFKSHIQKRLKYFNVHSKELEEFRTYKITAINNFKGIIEIFFLAIKLFTFIYPIFNSLRIFFKTKKIESFYEIFIPHIFFFAYFYNICRSKILSK